MNVEQYFQIVLANTPLIFALILSYLPMRGMLRFSAKRTYGIGALVILGFILAESAIIVYTDLFIYWVLLPFLPVFFLMYWKSLNTNIYKALTVFLVVYSFIPFVVLYNIMFSSRLGLGILYTDHAWISSLFIFLVCVGLGSLLYLPATIHLRWLVENYHIPALWKSSVMIPLLFIVVNTIIIPQQYKIIGADRFFYMFLLIVSMLLLCMCFMYYLLYQAARRNLEFFALERHNHFLGFQYKQYQSLTEYMNVTRRIRHDFRQQLATIHTLVQTENYASLRKYLETYEASVDVHYTNLCPNPAVNAIAAYYKESCAENEIHISWALNLPKELPISEPEYCVMLGNLIENAMDASKSLPVEERKISVISHMPTPSLLILIVENTHNTVIQKDKKKFLSSKHSGEAIGLTSVYETVQRHNGDLRIDYDDHNFSVNILLNL